MWTTERPFGTPNHRFFLAKLKAYGRQPAALKTMQKYLTDHYQKKKVNNVYNSWSKIIIGFRQGSILGPPLPNIFLNYLFSFAKEKFYGTTLAIILCLLLEIQWIKVKKELNNGFKIIGNWFQEKAFTAYTKLHNDPKQAKTKQNEPKQAKRSQKETLNEPKRAKTTQNKTKRAKRRPKTSQTSQNNPNHDKTSQSET